MLDIMGTRRLNLNFNKDLPEFNLALVGQLGVGKSALAVKYITRRFIMEYDPTLEDTYTKVDTIDGQDITARVMDTYDTEDSCSERYLKWAHGLLVVYSVTSHASFDIARTYLESIGQYARLTGREPIPTALVGNKVDLERYRTVSKASGEELASQYDCAFYETSAAEDFEPVCHVFHETVRDIVRATERQMTLQPLFITEGDKPSAMTPLGSRTTLRRAKSPKTQDVKDFKKDEKEQRLVPSRPLSGFRIFNKSFSKIFN